MNRAGKVQANGGEVHDRRNYGAASRGHAAGRRRPGRRRRAGHEDHRGAQPAVHHGRDHRAGPPAPDREVAGVVRPGLRQLPGEDRPPRRAERGGDGADLGRAVDPIPAAHGRGHPGTGRLSRPGAAGLAGPVQGGGADPPAPPCRRPSAATVTPPSRPPAPRRRPRRVVAPVGSGNGGRPRRPDDPLAGTDLWPAAADAGRAPDHQRARRGAIGRARHRATRGPAGRPPPDLRPASDPPPRPGLSGPRTLRPPPSHPRPVSDSGLPPPATPACVRTGPARHPPPPPGPRREGPVNRTVERAGGSDRRPPTGGEPAVDAKDPPKKSRGWRKSRSPAPPRISPSMPSRPAPPPRAPSRPGSRRRSRRRSRPSQLGRSLLPPPPPDGATAPGAGPVAWKPPIDPVTGEPAWDQSAPPAEPARRSAGAGSKGRRPARWPPPVPPVLAGAAGAEGADAVGAEGAAGAEATSERGVRVASQICWPRRRSFHLVPGSTTPRPRTTSTRRATGHCWPCCSWSS